MGETNPAMLEAEEMSKIEADDLIEKIAQEEAAIKAAEAERDDFLAHYQKKISAAEAICDGKCRESRQKIALFTEQLRRYAEVHLTGKSRSIKLPSGMLSFRAQSPKYFFDGLVEVTGSDERLIKFVKHNAHNYLKTKVEEKVDWAAFKSKLKTDGENVFYADTGEIIDGLHAQLLPDKFTVKIP